MDVTTVNPQIGVGASSGEKAQRHEPIALGRLCSSTRSGSEGPATPEDVRLIDG